MPVKAGHDKIYQDLPPLTSLDFLSLLATASAEELPAEVLARAFRALPPLHENSNETLARLLGSSEKYPYMNAVLKLARDRASWLTAAEGDAEDLFMDTVVTIIESLRLPRGGFAEASWIAYCKQRFEDSWRDRFGRNGIRRDPPTTSLSTSSDDINDDSGEAAVASDTVIEWHATVRPDKEEWLDNFIARQFAACADERLRAVALDQFLGRPPSNVNALSAHLGLSRFQTMRLIKRAQCLLFEALDRQDECELDLNQFAPALQRRSAPNRQQRVVNEGERNEL